MITHDQEIVQNEVMGGAVVDQAGNDVSRDAWERHCRILELRGIAERSFLGLGKELYWFEAERQWDELGYQSFNAYLADPDVAIGRSTAYRLKGIYKTYMLGLASPTRGLLAAGNKKLDILRPHMTPENVEEWVEKAGALSESDLKLEMEEAGMRPTHPKTDANQAQLISDCRAMGMYVWNLSRLGGEVLDRVVFWRGKMLPVEVKMPGHEGELTDGERTALRIFSDMGIPAIVATTAEDVYRAFGGE